MHGFDLNVNHVKRKFMIESILLILIDWWYWAWIHYTFKYGQFSFERGRSDKRKKFSWLWILFICKIQIRYLREGNAGASNPPWFGLLLSVYICFLPPHHKKSGPKPRRQRTVLYCRTPINVEAPATWAKESDLAPSWDDCRNETQSQWVEWPTSHPISHHVC